MSDLKVGDPVVIPWAGGNPPRRVGVLREFDSGGAWVEVVDELGQRQRVWRRVGLIKRYPQEEGHAT